MATKVAINGFGRIGRLARVAQPHEVEVRVPVRGDGRVALHQQARGARKGEQRQPRAHDAQNLFGRGDLLYQRGRAHDAGRLHEGRRLFLHRLPLHVLLLYCLGLSWRRWWRDPQNEQVRSSLWPHLPRSEMKAFGVSGRRKIPVKSEGVSRD